MADETALPTDAVDLQPIGELPPPVLASVAARLSRLVDLPVHALPPWPHAASRIAGREQLDAGALLDALEARMQRLERLPPAQRAPSAGRRLLVGVTAEDIAIPVFTFVFGLARRGGRACVVSLARTDPGFYGMPADADLRDGRAGCEILHELGHLAGLDHCADRGCLMSFAGSIEKADARGSRFCEPCSARLPRWLAGRPRIAEPA